MSDEPKDFSQVPINQELIAERKIELLTQMIRIRRFEQVSLKHYQGGKIGVKSTEG